MIGEPKFTTDGQYKTDTDEERAAALLSFVRCLTTGLGLQSVEHHRRQADELYRACTLRRYDVGITYRTEVPGCRVGKLDSKVHTIRFTGPPAQGDEQAHACDLAADWFRDWIREQPEPGSVEITAVCPGKAY